MSPDWLNLIMLMCVCLQIAGLLASILVLLVVVAIGFVFQPLPTVCDELFDMLAMELIDFVQNFITENCLKYLSLYKMTEVRD